MDQTMTFTPITDVAQLPHGTAFGSGGSVHRPVSLRYLDNISVYAVTAVCGATGTQSRVSGWPRMLSARAKELCTECWPLGRHTPH